MKTDIITKGIKVKKETYEIVILIAIVGIAMMLVIASTPKTEAAGNMGAALGAGAAAGIIGGIGASLLGVGTSAIGLVPIGAGVFAAVPSTLPLAGVLVGLGPIMGPLLIGVIIMIIVMLIMMFLMGGDKEPADENNDGKGDAEDARKKEAELKKQRERDLWNLCEPIQWKNSAAVSLRKIIQPTKHTYSFTYDIIACESDVNFEILLKNDKTKREVSVDKGAVLRGSQKSNGRDIDEIPLVVWDKVCIKINEKEAACKNIEIPGGAAGNSTTA